MEQERKPTIIFVSIVLATLLICGFIGYFNDPRRASTALSENTSLAEKKSLIELNYCYSAIPDLCIVSFGKDKVNNSLIVIKKNNPSVAQFYLKIKENDNWQRYECQQVQFSTNTFYCSGATLNDGAMITIDVYAEKDNLQIASGLLRVSFNATPVPEITKTPINGTPVIMTPTITLGTISPPTLTPSKTPSYPNYPN